MDSEIILPRSGHSRAKGVSYANAVGAACVIGLSVAAFCLYTDGPSGLILLYLAVLPVAVFLTLLRFGHESDISSTLYTEMLLLGGTLSIASASLLEGTAQTQARPIWQCQADPNFTWQCDALFVFAVVISVALTEEFSKILPLARLKRSSQYLPQIARFWFRKIETPRGLCMAGCASAAGFALVENIKYVFNTGRKDLEYGIDTSIARSLLAVPFHIVCTGYAAAVLSERWFVVPAVASLCDDQTGGRRATGCLQFFRRKFGSPPHDLRNSDVAAHLLMSHKGTSSLDELAGRLTCENSTIFTYMKLIAIPVLLHGLYDSGLFLASQLLAGRTKSRVIASEILPLLSTLPWRLSTRLGGNDIEEEYADALENGGDSLAVHLAMGCLALGFLSYATMILLFYRRWKWLGPFQMHAIPRLHRHFTQV